MPAPNLDLAAPMAEAGRLARLPALARLRAGRAQGVAVEIVWHDTPDGRLAAAGLALSECRLGRTRVWQLAALHAVPAATLPEVVAEAAAPDRLGRALPAPLLPVAACAGRLRTLPLAPAAGIAAVSVLEARLRAVADEHAFCRVRLHGVADPALARTLTESLRLEVATDTLAVAALGVAGRPVPSPEPPRLAADQSVSAAFAALLARQAGELLRLAPRAALGDGMEPVHQMRVALRRLRSAEKLFRRAVDCEALQGLKPELRELARHLGPARDWDVFGAGTGRAIEAAFPDDPAIARLRAAAGRKRAESYAALAGYLRGPAFRALGVTLVWLAAARPWEALPPADDAQAAARAQPLAAFAARALSRRLDHVLEPGADLSGLAPGELHVLRIQAKRLRYAAEFFAPLYPPGPVKRFVRRVAALQERLGALNDGTVAGGLMAALGGAERGHAAGVVRGYVAASHTGAARKLARTWRRVRRLDAFWA